MRELSSSTLVTDFHTHCMFEKLLLSLSLEKGTSFFPLMLRMNNKIESYPMSNQEIRQKDSVISFGQRQISMGPHHCKNVPVSHFS